MVGELAARRAAKQADPSSSIETTTGWSPASGLASGEQLPSTVLDIVTGVLLVVLLVLLVVQFA